MKAETGKGAFMNVLVVVVVAIFLSLVLIILLLYNAAKNKQQASYVKQNTIEFLVAGEKLLRILPNVEGRILTTEGKLVKSLSAGEKEVHVGMIAKWLREDWGFYWVSLFYPLRKIHKFNIIKERLKGSTEIGPNSKLRDMIERDKDPSDVDHLLAQFPRPFVFEAVETRENFTVDLLVSGIFHVVDPALIAFKYQERFFDLLKAVIGGAVMDYVKDAKSFQEFRESDKRKGSPFSDFMKKKLLGLEADLGVEIVDIWIEDLNLVDTIKEGDEVQKAVRALEIARLKGEARVSEANYNLTAAQLDARAKAAPVAELVNAYGGDPALASKDRVTQNLGQGSNIGTLVMSDGVGLTLPTSSKTPSTGSPPPGP